jgi:Fur family ferric uptake transcriptional regulator
MRKRRAVQQEVVHEILRNSARPLLPADILRIAEGLGQRLGVATVYRALRALLDAREIVSVFIQDGPARYELVESGHHHHFLCQRCRTVFDISGCLGREAFAGMVPDDFLMEGHELTLHGLCADCAGH